MPRSREDLTGQKFNLLTAIKSAGKGKWLFCCDCGNQKVIDSNSVKRGTTKSCGHLYGQIAGGIYGPFLTRQEAIAKGLTCYYAAPCSKGHTTGRQVANMNCIGCARLRAKTPQARARMAAYQRKLSQRPDIAERIRQRRQSPEAKAYAKAYADANRERLRDYRASRYQENKGEINAATRARYAEDIEFQLMTLLRGRFKKIIRGERSTENCRRLVGCTLDELRVHIESQFLPGMTWENRGLYGWHIDHIRPCASFDLTDPAQRAQCFHYTNLQPLWAADNLAKSTKWEAA
jgi:hypothetical protein